jgi:hypothetical protein
MQNKPSKLIPGLFGGAFVAFFSTVPILNWGNCLCCLWVVLGGGMAAWLYKRSLTGKMEMTSSDGAVAGLLSGIFGALFGGFLQYFFSLVGLDFTANFFKAMLDHWKDMKDVPREFTDSMEQFRSFNTTGPFFVLVGLMASLIVDSIFATAGGLLGAALFKKSGKPKSRRAR